MVALLVLIMATLEIVFFAEKKLLDGKGPFGGNVFKIRLDMLLKTRKILLKPFNVQHLHEAT